jgi:hypothetical protein
MVRSGLDDTMRTAYQAMREVWHGRNDVDDLRVAAIWCRSAGWPPATARRGCDDRPETAGVHVDLLVWGEVGVRAH